MIGRAALVVFACVGIRDLSYGTSLIGGFQQQKTEDEVIAELPFASTEQALIIYDEASKTEHLVMELRYAKTDASFGLLIPVPGTPTVEKVATAPFDPLRDIYTFSEPGLGLGYGTSLGLLPTYGSGRGGGLSGVGALDMDPPPPPPAVEVLDEHPVGSFTSFTLAIHDAGELDAWLKEKGFAAAKSVGDWAERYARMDFTFVALKYTAPDGGAGTTSQTVRISFPTPQIFFPYSEPVSSKQTQRLLAAWVIAPAPMRPIARLEEKKSVAQPWRAGMRFTATHDELATIFKELAPIIPAGDKLSVQTYRDWKSSRAGWGDVLFVPQKPTGLDDASKAERRRLLGVLDPDLVPPPKPKPIAIASAPIPVVSAAPAASAAPEPKGCNQSGGVPSPFLLVALGALVGRRRALAVLALVGCNKTPSPVTDAEPAPSASAAVAMLDAAPAAASTLSADDEKARVEAAFVTLSGEVPDGGVPILAGTAPIPPPVIPKPRVQSSATIVNVQVQGPMVVDIVRRVLAQHRAQMRYCYEKSLQIDPNGKGVVTIRMVISPNGDVSTASVATSTIASTEVPTCLVAMARRQQFPPGADAGITMVSFGVDMKPGS